VNSAGGISLVSAKSSIDLRGIYVFSAVLIVLLSALYMLFSNRSRHVLDMAVKSANAAKIAESRELKLQTLSVSRKKARKQRPPVDSNGQLAGQMGVKATTTGVREVSQGPPRVDDIGVSSSVQVSDSESSSDGSVNRDDVDSPTGSPAQSRPAKGITGLKAVNAMKENKAMRALNLDVLGAVSPPPVSRVEEGIAVETPVMSAAVLKTNKANRAVDLHSLSFKRVVPTTSTPRHRKLPSRFTDFFEMAPVCEGVSEESGAQQHEVIGESTSNDSAEAIKTTFAEDEAI
jgi:hypothetical protein